MDKDTEARAVISGSVGKWAKPRHYTTTMCPNRKVTHNTQHTTTEVGGSTSSGPM